jgi:hypothetical protein
MPEVSVVLPLRDSDETLDECLDSGSPSPGSTSIPARSATSSRGIPVRRSDARRDGLNRPFVLIYVTRHGARDEVAGVLGRWGYEPGKDYLPVG